MSAPTKPPTPPTLSTPPNSKLVAFYGDDFTGSTDALLVFSLAGVSTVLFLKPPTSELLAKFPDARCIGVAGMSRAQSPEWMERELPPLFRALKVWGAPLLFYKVCSTFDSSPHIGSIGKAIDIGCVVMGNSWSPIIVGAPTLRRYQSFGHLFAAAGAQVYRIDRHPTMSVHPVTPMNEADLRVHLAAQTQRPIELIDLMQLQSAPDDDARACLRENVSGSQCPAVFIDVVDEITQAQAGALVWQGRGQGLFSASSSGLPAALAAHWRAQGEIASVAPLAEPAKSVQQIAVVSGSCSPITAAQIEWAKSAGPIKGSAHGFRVERLQLADLFANANDEIKRCVDWGLEQIRQGFSPVVFSACGPNDASVIGFDALAQQAGLVRRDAACLVGHALAQIMRGWLDGSELRRFVVAGGDSSGDVASALDIDALTIAAPLQAGAPLCQAWSVNLRRTTLELVLKGGQMGSDDFFEVVRRGYC